MILLILLRCWSHQRSHDLLLHEINSFHCRQLNYKTNKKCHDTSSALQKMEHGEHAPAALSTFIPLQEAWTKKQSWNMRCWRWIWDFSMLKEHNKVSYRVTTPSLWCGVTLHVSHHTLTMRSTTVLQTYSIVWHPRPFGVTAHLTF